MLFSGCYKTEVIFECPISGRDGSVFGTRMRSPGFVRNLQCAVFSVIRKLVSSLSNGAQKNNQRLLRSSALELVRPTHAAGSRSVVRQRAHLSGDRSASRAVQELWTRETRAARLPGRQSF